MKCEAVLELIPVYFYGELPPAEEELLEQHLHACPDCTREMERQRAMAAALAEHQAPVPPVLLAECRADLMAAIQGGAPRGVRAKSEPGPWQLFLEALAHSLRGFGRLRQPLGATALVAIGFFAARLPIQQRSDLAAASSADQIFNTVRSVQPAANGGVQIAFDETRRRTVAGRMDDDRIRRLLVAASREDNPAVRVESVDVLKNGADSSEVRDALLNAAAHDPNTAVRLKAIEGLKPLAGDPSVRKTLAQVLLSDENSAVRMHVIDLLVEERNHDIVGVLQNLMQKEDNSYVRLKSEKALKEMNASVGTF